MTSAIHRFVHLAGSSASGMADSKLYIRADVCLPSKSMVPLMSTGLPMCTRRENSSGVGESSRTSYCAPFRSVQGRSEGRCSPQAVFKRTIVLLGQPCQSIHAMRIHRTQNERLVESTYEENHTVVAAVDRNKRSAQDYLRRLDCHFGSDRARSAYRPWTRRLRRPATSSTLPR